MQDEDSAWNNLVLWLQSKDPTIQDNLLVCSKQIPGAGRGLFTTTCVPPNTPLFTIPESAHINVKTLSLLYATFADTSLTATQLTSLHLFLHRPSGEKESASPCPLFGPYISILPKNFDGHPLSWLISSHEQSNDTIFLIDCLPPAVRRALDAMAGRFWEDWDVISQYLRKNPNIAASTRTLSLSPFISQDYIQSYLWAWLNGSSNDLFPKSPEFNGVKVNTRCIYHRLHPSISSPDNLTLCPLLDLANHTSFPTYASTTSPIPTFFSPSSRPLDEGEEVYLRYGTHSNVTLFTEYGFVEKNSHNGGQCDVQEILETLFYRKGALGEWMKTILESTNYWGNWTLHNIPAPAHPSYRLLPALRLMQLSDARSNISTPNDSNFETPDLRIWHETLSGKKDIVSPENERGVWQQLLEVCNIAAERAERGLSRLQQKRKGKNMHGWGEYAVDAIETLWLEEWRVAKAVVQSIKNGEAMN